MKKLEEKIAEYIINIKKDVDYFNERGEFDPNPYWMAEYIIKLINQNKKLDEQLVDNLDKRIDPKPISTTEVKVKVVGVLKIGESNLICPQCNRGFTEPETYGSVFCCKACEFGF